MIELKTKMLVLVLITILGLSIGYSALNTDLSISGDAEFIVSYDIAKNKILNDNGGANYIESRETPDFSKTANTDEGMFATLDNDGTSYYYRGAVDNNWLYFAGYYWRVVRVNGNGSIRLIYNGTTANQTGIDTQISLDGSTVEYQFNLDYSLSEYAGLKYTVGEQHGTSQKSNALEVLDSWYARNLLSYEDFIDDFSGFCNDRETYIGTGIGSNDTFFALWDRLRVNRNPSLKCSNILDNFTSSKSNVGNRSLQYPIGMLTADETAFAGAVATDNNSQLVKSNFYLNSGQRYWLMTPYCIYDAMVRGTYISENGELSGPHVAGYCGIRPVINLKANIMLSGNGTADNPYKIVD